MTANLHPLFLNLRNRTCVVVGGREMAEAKARELLDAGARIRLIAPEVTHQISAWVQAGFLEWEPRAYANGDLRDAFLVVVIADSDTNARVFADAEKQNTFCNAVDDIPHCSCYASAVVRRGPLQIAISTAGNSPALAQRLRKELERQFSEEYGPWVQQLGEMRALLQNKKMAAETRRKILHDQASVAAFEGFRTTHCREGDGHPSVKIPEGSGNTP
jgi:precorrin-2 dehydrogenase/sirohydrochlorin ferrochelatase